jgi:hypothetical protein
MFGELICPIYGNLNMSTIFNLVNHYASFGGSILGGLEIIPYGIADKYQYDFMWKRNSTTPIYYKGPV